MRLRKLQKNSDELTQKNEELSRKYIDIDKKYLSLRQKYDVETSINLFTNSKLDKLPCYKLMKCVLNEMKINESGHIKFETETQIIHGIICRVFNKHKTMLPGPKNTQHHITNLNDFTSIKCNNDENIELPFMRHVVATNKWRQLIKHQMNVSDKLNRKQTVLQLIRSNGSMKSF